MAELKMDVEWVLRVSHQELTLIRAALGGRLKEDRYEEAVALSLELARRVVRETKHRLHETEKLEQKLGEG